MDINPGGFVEFPTHLLSPTFVVVVRKRKESRSKVEYGSCSENLKRILTAV
jgi:hypothetical protein